MNIHLKYDRISADSFHDLIRLFSDTELKRITRSTVPLLAYWKNYEDRIREFLSHLSLGFPESVELSFEYKVPVQRGLGAPSHTDLMIRWSNTAIAVEAKWTEPPYKTVKEWFDERPSENRSEVLEGWLELIRGTTGTEFQVDDCLTLTYQTIHRAASACFAGSHHACLVYHYFSTEGAHEEHYLNQLGRLRDLIGNSSRLSLCLIEQRFQQTKHFDSTVDRIQKDPLETPGLIRQALVEDELFDFEDPQIDRIYG